MNSNRENTVDVVDVDLLRDAERIAERANASTRRIASVRKHPDLLKDSLGYAIKRAQVRVDEVFSRFLMSGLSPARFAALSTVSANPGITQTALGKVLNIGGSAVVKVVDDLQRMELVERVSNSDRRANALQLTKKGATEIKGCKDSIQECEAVIASQLTDEERSLLFVLLSKVAPNEP